jgi:ribosomal protein S17E
MSSMLDQAIIDATALREAAIKSAEQAVVEKYSTEIKEAVEKLMEENDFEENKSVDEQIVEADDKGQGYAFVEDTELSELEQNDLVEIDVKSLFEEVQKEQLDEELELSEDLFEEELDLSEMMDEDDNDNAAPDSTGDAGIVEEELELSEELEEALRFDYKPVPEGQTTAYGATRAQQAEQAMLMDVMLAVEEENSKLEKKNESLVKTNNKLKESNQRLKETVQNIADKFEEIKLVNSKLFYTNKTLMDDS